MSLAAT